MAVRSLRIVFKPQAAGFKLTAHSYFAQLLRDVYVKLRCAVCCYVEQWEPTCARV
jgi:hypothetical protein